VAVALMTGPGLHRALPCQPTWSRPPQAPAPA